MAFAMKLSQTVPPEALSPMILDELDGFSYLCFDQTIVTPEDIAHHMEHYLHHPPFGESPGLRIQSIKQLAGQLLCLERDLLAAIDLLETRGYPVERQGLSVLIGPMAKAPKKPRSARKSNTRKPFAPFARIPA